jgi:hypothetical protein
MLRAWMLVLASAGYIFAGAGTALFAGSASSAAAVKAWRLGSWLLSVLVFSCHFAAERHFRTRPVRSASVLACAVALGACGVAALGPLRAHWGEPARFRLVLLSVVAWPLITGVPAFFVALIARRLFDRTRQPSASASRAA